MEELHHISDHGAADDPHGLRLAPRRRRSTPWPQTCDRLPGLRRLAESCNCPQLAELAVQIDPLTDIKDTIYAAVSPDATVHPQGWRRHRARATTPRWTSCVPSVDNTKGILAQMEARLRQETGIPKLKIGYNHVFGYLHRGQQQLQRSGAGDLYPQADAHQRRALHHPGTQRAGKQDPRCQRAAHRAGTPPF